MFESIRWILDNIFGISGNGFVIRENISPENIETCNGVAVQDDKTRTCALCVALNDTVFRNDNKPIYYHPYCKCKNKKYDLTEVVFDFPIQKITKYLFVNEDKKAMMRTMGYIVEDANELYQLIQSEVETKFLSGDYKLKELNINGQHFTVNFILNGTRDHNDEKFNCHVGCVAWPFGKIKIATPLLKE